MRSPLCSLHPSPAPSRARQCDWVLQPALDLPACPPPPHPVGLPPPAALLPPLRAVRPVVAPPGALWPFWVARRHVSQPPLSLGQLGNMSLGAICHSAYTLPCSVTWPCWLEDHAASMQWREDHLDGRLQFQMSHLSTTPWCRQGPGLADWALLSSLLQARAGTARP